ncbi:MAG: hypothetical protein ACYDC2_04485, partial [Solirubrobacteraceae bacterium]
MGFVRNILKEVNQTEQLGQEAAAHLEALEELANTKAELFEATIKTRLASAGMGIDQTIPISQILDFTRETRAYIAEDAKNISGVVNEAITGFVEGGKPNIVSGIEKLLTTAITALFGESSGGEFTTSKYYVANEGIALVRIDFMAWKRQVKAVSLTEKIEQVSAFVLSKATVDIKKTSFDTFLEAYQNVVLASNEKLTPKEIIAEARTLYDDFTEKV